MTFDQQAHASIAGSNSHPSWAAMSYAAYRKCLCTLI